MEKERMQSFGVCKEWNVPFHKYMDCNYGIRTFEKVF